MQANLELLLYMYETKTAFYSADMSQINVVYKVKCMHTFYAN